MLREERGGKRILDSSYIVSRKIEEEITPFLEEVDSTALQL